MRLKQNSVSKLVCLITLPNNFIMTISYPKHEIKPSYTLKSIVQCLLFPINIIEDISSVLYIPIVSISFTIHWDRIFKQTCTMFLSWYSPRVE